MRPGRIGTDRSRNPNHVTMDCARSRVSSHTTHHRSVKFMTNKSIVALAVLIMVSGCGNDNPGGPSGGGAGSGGGSNRGTVTAVIDGVTFNGTATTAANNAAGIFS